MLMVPEKKIERNRESYRVLEISIPFSAHDVHNHGPSARLGFLKAILQGVGSP